MTMFSCPGARGRAFVVSVERVEHRADFGEQRVIVGQTIASAGKDRLEATGLGHGFAADVELMSQKRTGVEATARCPRGQATPRYYGALRHKTKCRVMDVCGAQKRKFYGR
jgi:hypothetical protein